MAFEAGKTVEQVAAVPRVKQAAQEGAELLALWPLSDAQRMDNDAKYAENLQVRITQALAGLMAGTDVRTADAEYVYEGAESIPGCDQKVVDALLAANDAYDAIDSFSETQDVALLEEAAETLDAGWDDGTAAAMGSRAQEWENETQRRIGADPHWLTGSDEASIAGRFAVMVAELDDLLALLATKLPDHGPQIGGADTERNAAMERMARPLVLFANELAERLAIPRVYATAAQLRGVAGAYDTPNGGYADDERVLVLAEALAPLAAGEWKRHRADVLWDPAKAKADAKAEDERKNKEALAAKFAHVKDDPTKEEVEL